MPKLNDGLNAKVKAKGKVEFKTKSKATATGKRNGKSTVTDNTSGTIPITESDNARAANAFFKTIRERKKQDGAVVGRASVEYESMVVVDSSPGPSRQKRPTEREEESRIVKDKYFGGDTGRMGGSRMKDEEEKERRRRLEGKEKAKEREKEKEREWERPHSSPAPIASLEAYQASSPTYKSRLSDSLSRPSNNRRPTIPSCRSNSKPTGLQAIKDTLRRPKPPTAPPGFSDDDEPIYDSSNEEREKLRLAGVKFFEEMKNRPIPISSPVYEPDPYPVPVQPSKEVTALEQLVAGYEDELDSDSDDEGGEEDREYLSDFCDPGDRCPFCGKPLPVEYSPSFRQAEKDMTARILQHGIESIPKVQEVQFCSAHKVETHIIPLGRRAGYPQEIDWMGLWKEMEVPWISRRIEMMVKRPLTSPMFRYYYSEREREREPDWARVYARATAPDKMAAGYYGNIGSHLIRAYLFELVEWNYLPLYKIIPRYKPLGPNEFIAKVLIPEVATMLIQARSGYMPNADVNESTATSLEDDHYTEAQKVRLQSIAYGTVAYGNMDSEMGNDIILDWDRGKERRKEEVGKIRGLPVKKLGKRKLKPARISIVDLTEEPEQDSFPKSSPVLVHDEEYDSDIQTLVPSSQSYKSSSSPRIASLKQPPCQSSQNTDTGFERKRHNNQSRGTSSQPTSQLQMISDNLPPSSPLIKSKKRQLTGRSQISMTLSQDSFGDLDIDISSQDLERIDACVVAAASR